MKTFLKEYYCYFPLVCVFHEIFVKIKQKISCETIFRNYVFMTNMLFQYDWNFTRFLKILTKILDLSFCNYLKIFWEFRRACGFQNLVWTRPHVHMPTGVHGDTVKPGWWKWTFCSNKNCSLLLACCSISFTKFIWKYLSLSRIQDFSLQSLSQSNAVLERQNWHEDVI